VAREKLKEFLNSIGSSKQGITYTVDPTYGGDDSGTSADESKIVDIGDDLGKDPGTGKDLVSIGPDLGDSLINDFLEYLTFAENYYSISGGSQRAPMLSHLDASGNPVVLKPAESQGSLDGNVFVKTSESDGEMGSSMSQYSNSGYFDGESVKLKDIISKLGNIGINEDTGDGPHSGNNLLPSIEGTSLDATGKTVVDSSPSDASQNLTKGVQDVVLSRNRFKTSDNTPYKNSDIDISDFESGINKSGTRTSQVSIGNYNANPQESQVMTNEKLEKIARSMMLKALGLDYAGTPGESTDPDEYSYDNDIAYAVSALPGPLPLKSTKPREAYGSPQLSTGQSTRDGKGAFELSGKQSSYGSSYTPDLKYNSNASSAVIKARAAATIIGMMNVLQGTVDILSAVKGDGDKIDLRSGPLLLGQAKRVALKSRVQLFQKYLSPYTKYPFMRCLNQGMLVLFGKTYENRGDLASNSDRNDISGHQTVSEAPGFWYSISRSILNKYILISSKIGNNEESYTSYPSAALSDTMSAVANTGLVGIINAVAEIGDISLRATGGVQGIDAMDDPVAPWNVDKLYDGPSTRVSKSRSSDGQTSLSLAWRGSSSPGMYLLPRNVMLAATDMNTFANGANPTKGHMTSDLMMKTYVNVNGAGQSARIPTDVVQRLENAMDAEYVPFYFHDVRTNEMIGFHAFLDNLSDSYTVSHNGQKGYGRVEDVKVYRSTTRSLTFSFYIAATSKEDFDEMWFKINKLVTLAYPQWTKGTAMKTPDGADTFIQPFSQVIGATPLVRLRIGDVIKGNYSRFNLARMFGVGERDFEISGGLALGKSGLLVTGNAQRKIGEVQLETVFKVMFGSPLALGIGSGDAGAGFGDKILRTALSGVSLNGFVNPIGAGLVLRQLRSPDIAEKTAPESASTVAETLQKAAASLAGSTAGWFSDDVGGYTESDKPILKASIDLGYELKSGTTYRITRPYVVQVIDKKRVDINSIGSAQPSKVSKGFRREGEIKTKVRYTVKIIDYAAPSDIYGKSMTCYHEDLMPNPDVMFLNNIAPFMNVMAWGTGALSAFLSDFATQTGFPNDAMQLFTTNANEFMHPGNNSITRAFENSGGRGLAGVFRSLSFNWIDPMTTWEIDWNSRAPKFCKVQVGFDVIHDLPPGIDSSGYNRAPIYNVGNIMNSVAGDVQPDGGRGSQDSYKRAGKFSAQPLDKNKL